MLLSFVRFICRACRLLEIGKAHQKSIEELKSADNEKDDARAEIDVSGDANKPESGEKKEAKS